MILLIADSAVSKDGSGVNVIGPNNEGISKPGSVLILGSH
jgi:hypothetical protein